MSEENKFVQNNDGKMVPYKPLGAPMPDGQLLSLEGFLRWAQKLVK